MEKKDFRGIKEIRQIADSMCASDIKLAIYEIIDSFRDATLREHLEFIQASQVIKDKFSSN